MRLLRWGLSIAILGFFTWSYARPFAGKTLFRRTIVAGGDAQLGYSIEAYHWQGEFQHAWEDVGFCVKVKTKDAYDSAEFPIDYHNLVVDAIEQTRIRKGVLHLRLRTKQFEDSACTAVLPGFRSRAILLRNHIRRDPCGKKLRGFGSGSESLVRE